MKKNILKIKEMCVLTCMPSNPVNMNLMCVIAWKLNTGSSTTQDADAA